MKHHVLPLILILQGRLPFHFLLLLLRVDQWGWCTAAPGAAQAIDGVLAEPRAAALSLAILVIPWGERITACPGLLHVMQWPLPTCCPARLRCHVQSSPILRGPAPFSLLLVLGTGPPSVRSSRHVRGGLFRCPPTLRPVAFQG